MEHKRTDKKIDNVFFGIIMGLIIPFVLLLLFWYAKFYPEITFTYFLKQQYGFEVLLKVVSLCALSDIPLFYVFYTKHYDKAAKGVIGALMIMIIITVIAKI